MADKKEALDKALANSLLDSAQKYRGPSTASQVDRDILGIRKKRRGGTMRKQAH